MDKHEIILLCETANRHPPEFAWTKDGAPLASKADTLKVSLDENAGAGKYECHVTNIAGSVSKSLVISPIGKTGEGFLDNFVLIRKMVKARQDFIYLYHTQKKDIKKDHTTYVRCKATVKIARKVIQLGGIIGLSSREPRRCGNN